jgi:hypothetical protein
MPTRRRQINNQPTTPPCTNAQRVSDGSVEWECQQNVSKVFEKVLCQVVAGSCLTHRQN